MPSQSTNLSNLKYTTKMENTTQTNRYYYNRDANGCYYVSKKPMNDKYYMCSHILHCEPTKRKRITQKLEVGAICITINNEILKIVKIKARKGY